MQYVIVHYTPSIDRSSGGVGGYLQVLSHDLGKHVELHVVTHHSVDELEIENAHIHYIDGRLSHLFQARRQFRSLLEAIRPDVVHVNSCWEVLCSYTVFWAKSMGYPVVITPHGMLEPWVIQRNYWIKKLPALCLYQKRSLRMANALIATAESEKENLLRLGYNRHVDVVQTGIVMDAIRVKQDWQRHKTIMFLALLRPNKGADLLIKAVSELKAEMNGYHVIIAGSGDPVYVDTLKRLVSDLGLEEMVVFTGAIYGEDKWNLYREADIFVLPTLNENFGIVVAEALACGTPVITTKGAPWRDLVNWDCGWWIDRDIDHLVEAIKRFMLLNEEELERMGRNGRKLVEEKYSSKRMAAEMLDLYKRLVENVFGRAHFHMV